MPDRPRRPDAGRPCASSSASPGAVASTSLLLLALVPLALAPAPAGAQAGQSPATERPAADPADVESPAAIVAAAYEVVSGPAGQERDWDRFRSLVLPEARLIPTGRSEEGRPTRTVLTTEEFVEFARQTFSGEAFYEREIHAVSERFGDIAHVFSTYESLRSPDAEPFDRGVNSFQLWFDGDRWWIVTIFWHGEREGAPIPERYGG